MAIEDRLRDARLTGDLGGRRTGVAPLREDAQGRVDDRLPPLGGRQARGVALAGRAP